MTSHQETHAWGFTVCWPALFNMNWIHSMNFVCRFTRGIFHPLNFYHLWRMICSPCANVLSTGYFEEFESMTRKRSDGLDLEPPGWTWLIFLLANGNGCKSKKFTHRIGSLGFTDTCSNSIHTLFIHTHIFTDPICHPYKCHHSFLILCLSVRIELIRVMTLLGVRELN
jgi:hypothetical protein